MKTDSANETEPMPQDLCCLLEDSKKKDESLVSICSVVRDAVILVDKNGFIRYWNPSAERIFGYKSEEALNNEFQRLCLIEKGLPTLINKYQDEYIELTGTRNNNTEFPVELSVSFIEIKEEEHYVFTARDITKFKEKEKALLESEEVHRLTLSNISDALFITDDRGMFTYICPNVDVIFGYSIQEVEELGNIRRLLGAPPVTVDELISKGEVHNIECSIKDKDLKEHFLLVNVKRVAINGGTILYSCRDVTERKAAEDELSRYRNHLEEMVRDRTKALTAANERLHKEIAERAKTEETLRYRVEIEKLISNISKDFITLAPSDVDKGIDLALRLIGAFADVDRSYMFQFSEDGKTVDNTHEWCAYGIEPQIENLKGLSIDQFPWWMDNMRRFEYIHIPVVADLPNEAMAEKEILQSQDIKSLICVPIIHGNNLGGFIGFDSVRRQKRWFEEDIELLKVLGDTIANTIHKKEIEEEIRLNDVRIETLLELNQMQESSIEDIFDFTLKKGIELTMSTIGFLGFMSDDEEVLNIYTWSKEAMKQCRMTNKPLHFPIESSGLWAEAVRQRKPIIINDYSVPNPYKKGYPEGHVHLSRLLVVPVIYGKKIVAVGAVGNKGRNYTKADLQQFTLLLEGMWKIIDNKRIEDELHNKHNLLQAVIDGTPDAVFVKDMNGRFLMINTAGADLLGSPKEEILGKSNFDFLPTDMAKRFSEDDQRIMAQRVTETYESDVTLPDGSDKTFLVTKGVYYNQQGAVAGITGIGRDITELKRTEENLRSSEAKYRTLVEQIPAITYTAALDTTSTTLYVSPQVESILGFTQEEYRLNQNLWDEQLHSDDKDRVLGEVIKSHERIIPFATEYRMFSKNGDILWLRDEAVIVKDDKEEPLFLQGIMLDITRQKESETALKESEKKYRELTNQFNLILDTIPVSLFLLDVNLNVRYANESMRKNFDNPSSGFIGEKCCILKYGNSDPCENCQVLSCIQSGQMEINQHVTGEGKILEVITVPLLDLHGSASNILYIEHDITERTRLQTDALRTSQLTTLGNLSAGIAHEINNPINGIINYAHLLKVDCKDDQRRDDLAELIKKEGTRISNIVRNLLTFARDSSHEKDICDIKTVIEETLNMSKNTIKREGIILKEEIPWKIPLIKANPQKLQQVLFNIISNARYALNKKYSDKDKNKILEVTCKTVIKRNKKKIRLILHDFGTGIPDEMLDKVFNPFVSSKPMGEGTGLGLSISHGIITDHDGTINIESKEGEYTRVIIDLPVEDKKR